MRKKKVIKPHAVKPDPKFASVIVSRLTNKIMKNGNKRKAREIVYQAAAMVERKTSLPFLTVFEGALTNIKPAIEMKSRRVGSSKQRTPKEIDDNRSTSPKSSYSIYIETLTYCSNLSTSFDSRKVHR